MHLRIFLVMLAGWMNEQQRAVNSYLKEENRVLREFEPIVTPDTILRWHRELIARKYDGSAMRGPGRPPIAKEIRALAVRMATENKRWGYTLERCHQGIGNRLIDGVPELASGPVVRQERLGGILSHYHREVA